MGVNARVSSYRGPLTARVTREREARDREARERVRSGDMTLDEYLQDVRGFRPEHVTATVRAKLRKAIFGDH